MKKIMKEKNHVVPDEVLINVSYGQLTQQTRLRKKIAPFLRVLRTGDGLFTN
ncbi:hypothetical protein [Bacteroides heparinolyticus]|uniref:hypothetical protein n=1 Tax=Prevotella heparinolytica TaxID=28113 RepID=UPI00359F416A